MEWNKNFFLNLLSFRKKEKKKEYCFGLVLKEEEGEGLILEISHQEKKIKKIDEKEFSYSDGWEKLAEDVDQVLFELENNHKIRVEKVIFFLFSHLVDQKTKQIKNPYLKKIKQLVKELELKPLGFIELHEALSFFLREEEKESLTASIVELDKSSVSLFIYQRGGLIFSDSVARTENLISDLELIIKKVQKSIILPSRVIIYNLETLGGDLNYIISHRFWEKLFVQIPKIETFSFDQLKKALVFAFSDQFFLEEKEVELIEEKKEVMGFVVGEDIREKKPSVEKKIEEKVVIETKEKKTPLAFPNINWQRLIFPLLIGAIVLIFVFGISLLYFFHQVSLVLYFQGKKIEKEIILRDQSLIKRNESLIEKEDSIATSGKKIIGEKAGGEVVIFNSTSQEKEFEKGTILETGGGVKFVLGNNVKVASASQTLTGEGNLLTITGKAKGKITAVEIGPSGNIKKNEKLKIVGLSSDLFFALPTEDLTGGSQQEIQTVSKDDMKKLKEDLLSKIKKEGSLAIKEKIKNDQLIDNLTKVEIVEEKFSKELGEEAKNLRLKIKAKTQFFTFNRPQARETILKILKESIDPNYQLSEKSLEFWLKQGKEEEKKIVLIFSVLGKIIEKKDRRQLIAQLKGKNIKEMDKIVKKNLGAIGYEITMKRKIPFLDFWMPFFEKNIQLRIESL